MLFKSIITDQKSKPIADVLQNPGLGQKDRLLFAKITVYALNRLQIPFKFNACIFTAIKCYCSKIDRVNDCINNTCEKEGGLCYTMNKRISSTHVNF